MKSAILSVALLLAAGEPTAAADSSASRVSATARDGLVTLSAQAAPLREILTEFGRASGIEIFLESSVAADEPATVAFDDAPPESGLRRLLRAKNFMLIYTGGSLSQVRVYTEGRGDFSRLPTEPKGRPAKPPATRTAPDSAAKGPAADQGSAAAPDKEATRLRAEALGNPDPEQRVAGLEELAAGDYPQIALDTAVTVLRSERVPDVLHSALIVLSGMDTVPLEPVLTFLNDNRVQDSAVRVRALELLSEHGQNDPRVRDLLGRIARSDKDQEVRESAKSFLEDLAQ